MELQNPPTKIQIIWARQKKLLRGIEEGSTNDEIALTVGCKVCTVEKVRAGRIIDERKALGPEGTVARPDVAPHSTRTSAPLRPQSLGVNTTKMQNELKKIQRNGAVKVGFVDSDKGAVYNGR
jgi:hypothetical protein